MAVRCRERRADIPLKRLENPNLRSQKAIIYRHPDPEMPLSQLIHLSSAGVAACFVRGARSLSYLGTTTIPVNP